MSGTCADRKANREVMVMCADVLGNGSVCYTVFVFRQSQPVLMGMGVAVLDLIGEQSERTMACLILLLLLLLQFRT
jgi:hypothetical protein